MVLNDRVNGGCRMSVLIKNIKMPESCLDCPIYDNYDYQCNLYSYGIPAGYNYNPSKRPEWCELEELPEHHGRLIDADAMKNLWAGCSINGSISPLLDTRPTVVEAE